jgi:hypothetical protein
MQGEVERAQHSHDDNAENAENTDRAVSGRARVSENAWRGAS